MSCGVFLAQKHPPKCAPKCPKCKGGEQIFHPQKPKKCLTGFFVFDMIKVTRAYRACPNRHVHVRKRCENAASVIEKDNTGNFNKSFNTQNYVDKDNIVK